MERMDWCLNALGLSASEANCRDLIHACWHLADQYAEGSLDVRRWRDESGVEAWLGCNSDGTLDGMAFGLHAEPGVHARLHACGKGGTAVGRVFSRDNGEELYHVLVASPHFWFSDAVSRGMLEGRASLVMIASAARLYATSLEMADDQSLGGISSMGFVPSGLFPEEGNPPTTDAFLTGRVIHAEKRTNGLCSSRFHVLRVETLGGEVTVALANEPGFEVKAGEWIAAGGTMYGTIPSVLDNIEAIRRPANEAPAEDSEQVWLERLRDLCVAYFNGSAFTPYFESLHIDPKVAGAAKAISWVMAGRGRQLRGALENRGKATPELRRRYAEMARSAPIVSAPIVMANSILREPGNSAPALVLVCIDESRTTDLFRIHSEFKRILFGYPENDVERSLQDEFEDEEYVFGRRRRIPEEIAGDLEVYAADLQIEKSALGPDGLLADVLFCLAEPGPDGLTILIPSELVKRAMSPLAVPPPLSKGPPPLPPG